MPDFLLCFKVNQRRGTIVKPDIAYSLSMSSDEPGMDLYSPTILQLSKSAPRYGQKEDADHEVRAYNTFCGDKFKVRLDANGVVEDAMFEGYGCSVSKASCAILTESIIGKNWTEVRSMCDAVIDYLEGNSDSIDAVDPRLTDFAVVRKYPGRFDCAALAWQEMRKFVEEFMSQSDSNGNV